MTKQRKPIDMAALTSIALPQRDPVAAVIEHPRANVVREVPPKPKLERAPKVDAGPKAKAAPATLQSSRAGKVGIQIWTTPGVRKALRHYATDNDRTMSDLMDEALSDLMVKLKLA